MLRFLFSNCIANFSFILVATVGRVIFCLFHNQLIIGKYFIWNKWKKNILAKFYSYGDKCLFVQVYTVNWWLKQKILQRVKELSFLIWKNK